MIQLFHSSLGIADYMDELVPEFDPEYGIHNPETQMYRATE